MTSGVVVRLVVLAAVLGIAGCPGDDDATGQPPGGDDDSTAGDDDADDDSAADDDTNGDDDTTMPPGDRAVSGRAYFFDAAGIGQIEELSDVEGAEVYLAEYPNQRQEIAPDGLFRFENLPDHSPVTVGLDHPDFYPSLTATLSIGTEDLEGVTFQGVTWAIAEFLGLMLGLDPYDTSVCSMVVTVTAMGENQDSVYAPGEPGVVVQIDPPVPPDHGPVYFNTSVVPDSDLTQTTTDGGVIVAGVQPGTYTWTATKEGLVFDPLQMTCIGGALTNGSPPYGLQAQLPCSSALPYGGASCKLYSPSPSRV